MVPPIHGHSMQVPAIDAGLSTTQAGSWRELSWCGLNRTPMRWRRAKFRVPNQKHPIALQVWRLTVAALLFFLVTVGRYLLEKFGPTLGRRERDGNMSHWPKTLCSCCTYACNNSHKRSSFAARSNAIVASVEAPWVYRTQRSGSPVSKIWMGGVSLGHDPGEMLLHPNSHTSPT